MGDVAGGTLAYANPLLGKNVVQIHKVIVRSYSKVLPICHFVVYVRVCVCVCINERDKCVCINEMYLLHSFGFMLHVYAQVQMSNTKMQLPC